MKAVDAVIRERLNSDVVLIRTIGDYIIGAGGKRMRPAMVLMVARALGYEGTHHQLLAAVVEFIHTATLLHDDVVATPPTPSSATPPACWWAIICIPARSR